MILSIEWHWQWLTMKPTGCSRWSFENSKKILDMLNKHRPKKTQGVSRRWQTLVSVLHSPETCLANYRIINQEIGNPPLLKWWLFSHYITKLNSETVHLSSTQTQKSSLESYRSISLPGPSKRDLLVLFRCDVGCAIDSVKRLVPFLTNLNIPTFSIHSSMIQAALESARTKVVMKKIRLQFW